MALRMEGWGTGGGAHPGVARADRVLARVAGCAVTLVVRSFKYGLALVSRAGPPGRCGHDF